MTADEIRSNQMADGLSAERHTARWLQEIAAQLAELNERLKPLEIRDRTFEYPEGRP